MAEVGLQLLSPSLWDILLCFRLGWLLHEAEYQMMQSNQTSHSLCSNERSMEKKKYYGTLLGPSNKSLPWFVLVNTEVLLMPV